MKKTSLSVAAIAMLSLTAMPADHAAARGFHGGGFHGGGLHGFGGAGSMASPAAALVALVAGFGVLVWSTICWRARIPNRGRRSMGWSRLARGLARRVGLACRSRDWPRRLELLRLPLLFR